MNDQLPDSVEKMFICLDGFDHLMGRFDEVESTISFTELYAYATRPNYQASPKLALALGSNLSVRRDFNRLLQKKSLAHFPKLAAASSGEVTTRTCDGFELILQPSKANEDQLYLTIKADDPELNPTLLFILQDEEPPLRLEIDDFYEGEAQILLSSQDAIVKGLRNLQSEVILR